MGAPKGNTFAKGNNGGNPGYGKMAFIKNNVVKHSQAWWENWEAMMNGNDKDYKKLAMTEFNKLQVKMVPQKLEDDEGNAVSPVLVTFLNAKPTTDNTDADGVQEAV